MLVLQNSNITIQSLNSCS